MTPAVAEAVGDGVRSTLTPLTTSQLYPRMHGVIATGAGEGGERKMVGGGVGGLMQSMAMLIDTPSPVMGHVGQLAQTLPPEQHQGALLVEGSKHVQLSQRGSVPATVKAATWVESHWEMSMGNHVWFGSYSVRVGAAQR